ncbi:hypothetical protein LRR18_10185 [Mangrovimonas sp. AS39]|uniref:TolB family protein n=1 Tax=Mangrovimonas futianensis TaxID=2895523 RepID=UPI001E2FDD9D|nr:hypothetical protein [Mangrovimonas futianensis]MCF1191952.1 hypothetical protein [Mangrovimonas futianensis]MCF1195646.1 hypothetical protein [Mangrovimonas futianensis]
MKKYISFLTLFLFVFSYAQKETYHIKNIKLNDEKSHYGVSYFKDGKVFFTSFLLDDKNKIRLTKEKIPVFSLFSGDMDAEGEISNVEPFKSSEIYEFNCSSASFSPDKKYIYITTNYVNKGDDYKKNNKIRNLRLERGEYVPGRGWVNFKTLPFCDDGYSYGHPAVSPDGAYLYFTANIPEARGPTDVFRVRILGGNEYSEIENIGREINSNRKDMFPFVSKDNILYFSSDRAGGYKGLDVYYCQILEDGTFSKPKLMPKPINSAEDDFGFMLLDDEKSGYFSSTRYGGQGEDDIYYFTKD